jgi:signal transduction histidine kinase/HAMP domain-containing protein
MRYHSLRTKLLYAFLLLIVAFNIVFGALLYIQSRIISQYKAVSDNMIIEFQLTDAVSGLIASYNNRFLSNDINQKDADQKITNSKAVIKTAEAYLDRSIVDRDSRASYVGLKNTIADVTNEIDEGLVALSKNDLSGGSSHYQAANQKYVFVTTNSTALIFSDLKYANSLQKKINQTYNRTRVILTTVIFLLFGLAVYYSFRFARKMIVPLTKLSSVAGVNIEATIDSELLEQQDEVGSLANSFRLMFESLKEKIHELNTAKASVEKQVEDRTHELHAEQAKLLASIQGLPTGFTLADSKGNILIQNNRVQAIFGLNSQPGSLTQLSEHLKSFDLAVQLNKVLETKKALQFDEVAVGANILRLFMGPVTVHEDGVDQIIGVVILSEDITEAKILDRSKDEFFSIASHELRTPLTAIRGNMSMIQQYFPEIAKNQDLKDMVGDSYESSTRLIDIVNDFLDLSRIEQGKMSFKIEDFPIEPVIENVVYEMKGILQPKNLYLKFDKMTLDSLPPVRADKDRVKQIIYNLVGNASKFTEQGGISISSEHDANFIKVTVTDTGRGISPEGQKLLFHKFQQTGSSLLTRDTTRGTGLGLYISKMLVEKMGGKVNLERSEEGKGSTFSFTLPIAGTAQSPQAPGPTQTDIKTGMSVEINSN